MGSGLRFGGTGGLVTCYLRHMVPPPVGASAIIPGHVIMGRDIAARGRARDHEHVHVHQEERWELLCFFSICRWSSIWAYARGQHAYRDNISEKEAYARPRCEITVPPDGSAAAPMECQGVEGPMSRIYSAMIA